MGTRQLRVIRVKYFFFQVQNLNLHRARDL